MRMHRIPLAKNKEQPRTSANQPVIGFISLTSRQDACAEVNAAYAQLATCKGYAFEFITMKEFGSRPKKNSRFAVIWIHRPDTTPLSQTETQQKFLNAVKNYLSEGGNMLLSQQAAHYLNVLGLETHLLQDSTKSCTDDGYGRRLGFHAFREHPLFTGLNGGAYICRPPADITARITGFFGTRLPMQGKVVAVDWDYIFLREDTKIILEYTPGKGKVIAVGGYMNFNQPNSNRAHLDMFTKNCFNYLCGSLQGQPEHYWDYAPRAVIPCLPRPENDRLLRAIPPAKSWNLTPGPVDLKRSHATENFWDVAGERLLIMGTENAGIEEVWAHPFMAFRDYEVGIRFSYNDTIFWLADERPEITVNPAYFSRQYKFARAYLKEIVVSDPLEPDGVIHYEYRGVYPARLIVRFRSNLRWMWPYSDRVTGSICHAWDNDLDAITIGDQSGELQVMIGGNKKPVAHQIGQFDDFKYIKTDSSFVGIPTDKLQVAGLLAYDLLMNDNLDIVFTATSEGCDKTSASFSRAVHQPASVYNNAMLHTHEILSENLMITTPDPDFNTGYRWAMLATDRFFVNTPGMGKALVAGYSTTRHGWDGGHAVNGRPGYGWYFGRDAEWSSFALLDCGDFDKVKSQLAFFNKYQDLNGKIFHEASTSGLIHYDAADATPLYILLAGKYFRHTNDTAFIRKTWPNIKHAINFCYSTDTDQDHLIENTNVGHGWVEGGELYGSHSTIYMAGIWGAALTEAASMARFMHDIEADSYDLEAGEQSRIINSDFWSDQKQFFAYGKNKDGSFRREQTILPAVPISLGMTDRDYGSLALKSIAGNAFTTNWGVRILREDSPWFKPTGYHYGSVWPLFTGWASLAEYRTGNPIQGFSHLMNNLGVYRNWGLGFVEEVLNGAEYKPSGVCAHQCWSETMVLQPAIEGMLGLDIRAQERRINLGPQIPPQWDSLSARHIRMADQFVNMNFKRVNGSNAFHFSLSGGSPVTIGFMPCFSAGTTVKSLTLNGVTVPFTTFTSGQATTLVMSFELSGQAAIMVETTGGISVIPLVVLPNPGDPAEGIRVISALLKGNRYQVEVEGKSGSSGDLEIWSNGGEMQKVENALFLNRNGMISRFAVDFEQSQEKYLRKTVSIEL